MTSKKLTFTDLLKQKTWTDYSQFVSEAPAFYNEEVAKHVIEEKKLIEELKRTPEFKSLKIRKAYDKFDEANNLLFTGKVVAVDGTRSQYRLYSGIRCQVGVVAVNYTGEKIQHSFYISEANLKDSPDDVLSRIAGRVTFDDNLSDMAIRGLMLYREREAGLSDKFKDCKVMFHGPLLPFELMSGLGRLEALNATLEILRQIVKEKRFFSVISSTAYQDYLTFGRAINPGEYFTAEKFTLGHHLANSSSFLSYKDKWRPNERVEVEEFIRNYCEQILIGVIRVGERPYVFHAHREIFDLAAAIIYRDSLLQREKGFPLLLDYADSLCTQYFKSSDYKSLIEYELAKRGAYLSEAPERELRRK
ncbi:hypothetical protein [Thermincola ferriacetica]